MFKGQMHLRRREEHYEFCWWPGGCSEVFKFLLKQTTERETALHVQVNIHTYALSDKSNTLFSPFQVTGLEEA